MNDCKLALYRFLGEDPLHQYCIPRKDGGRSARILLLGYGARMDQILDVALCCGQLPDTDLSVTYAAANPAGAMDALLRRSPELPRFLALTGPDGKRRAGQDSGYLGALTFRAAAMTPAGVGALLAEDSGWSFLFISTGRDEKNLAMAQAAAAFPFDHPVCIAYVQKGEAEALTTASPMVTAKPISLSVPREALGLLERIALNLHYLYSKSANDRADPEAIRASFREPSVYLSNIEAALHIRSKLACCGVTQQDPDEAARAFHALLLRKPTVVDSLSAAEHKRWMMQKLLDGYRREETLAPIFQNGNTTGSSREKWHICLVPSDPTGRSRLTEADWTAAPCNRRKDLDPLDQLSLQVHDRCQELSEAGAAMVDALLQTLQVHINGMGGCSFAIQRAFNRLRFLILQLRQNKHSAVALYDQCRRELRDMLEKAPTAASGLACSTLDAIHQGLDPLLAWVSRRDFKAIDRQMVSCIPFALTNRISPPLMKLWSPQQSDNLAAARKLESRLLVYCDAAATEAAWDSFHEKREALEALWQQQDPGVTVRWLLLVPRESEEDALVLLDPLPGNVELLTAETWSVEGLSQALAPCLNRLGLAYVDVTGADPLLAQAAYDAAAAGSTGVFYRRDGRFQNLRAAQALTYDGPDKNMTIPEMFQMSGAQVFGSACRPGTDFSRRYLDLWDIAFSNQKHWNHFCSDLGQVCGSYRRTRGQLICCLTPEQGAPASQGERRLDDVPLSAVEALLPLLAELEARGYLLSSSAQRGSGLGYTLLFRADPARTNSAALEEFLRTSCRKNPATHWWQVSEGPAGCQVVCESLEVRDLVLPRWSATPQKAGGFTADIGFSFLKKMARAGLLGEFHLSEPAPAGENSREGTRTCSFTFASREVLECVQTSGTILEYVLYYTALLDAHFYDVERSVSFRHSAQDDSARNEIDVICTRGSSSLWISAKLVNDLEDNFNYFLYEIALMSKEFGVNARPVLAAPKLSQFQKRPLDGKRVLSDEARQALNRGVYLLGRECFTSGRLGEVLDRIADGRQDWCSFLPED